MWFHLHVKSKKQLNKHKKTEIESEIQRMNMWLLEGKEVGR